MDSGIHRMMDAVQSAMLPACLFFVGLRPTVIFMFALQISDAQHHEMADSNLYTHTAVVAT